MSKTFRINPEDFEKVPEKNRLPMTSKGIRDMKKLDRKAQRKRINKELSREYYD